ncbi:zinc-binding dehydrogenase [Phenylobacterium sp.]|uniref:zinc-binding dehydrogenase n=1 Tax=Phenylobacterium sp. TaxID=1871053 RepID=UPI0027321385|nr:zinc-binding dehydrogenase [Phenylobacterium sp.]MDP1985832.1 zinc-binding dehydrogenase [Phenylobacterium sp.]
MSDAVKTTGLELRSLITSDGELRLSLERVPTPEPGPGQLLVKVQASPINPSDLGLLLGPADMATLKASGEGADATLTAKVPPQRMGALRPRLDQSLAVGNEGAGLVIKAGQGAEAYLGKTVAMLGGAMYAEHRLVGAAEVMVLPEGATAADGASCFVNPLTALSMVEVMRREGHKALVHTAAASNLGQMLNKICLKDGVPLVNIVRSDAQAKILRDIGAKYVLDSTSDTFMADLTDAMEETGATLAFDAIGGGDLANKILVAMEAALNRKAEVYSRYGSPVHKLVYIYGGLELRRTEIDRSIGMAWGVGGWLLTYFLQKIGAADAQKLRDRVMAELTTTFASHYTAEISLAEVLKPETVAAYTRKATGEKYLVNPAKA